MSYQVLARKWRPASFNDFVGQSHVVQALTNALNNQRLHHAYLFTGTRGVGKTTLARIFAKALNCDQGISASPCGVCSHCQQIDQGCFPDLIEVDAASRTKVEQTRELLENVPFAPVSGRFKVYLIDEVHMFSSGSFNALLKTLEEPPEHVKFLLATTDPQKVPVTVLSRCLQLSLKPMPMDQISGHLSTILAKESIEFESSALKIISRSADGSMRDGLSLLDQSINYGAGKVLEADVRSMLGILPGEKIHALISALANQDANKVLAVIEDFSASSVDFFQVLQALLIALHRLALYLAVKTVNDQFDDIDLMKQHAAVLSAEDVQLFYQIALIGHKDLPLAPDPRSGFEMVMLRILTFIPATLSTPLVETQATQPATPHQTVAREISSPAPVNQTTQAVVSTQQTTDISDWSAFIAQLNLKGMAGQLANNCTYLSWDGKILQLSLDKAFRHLLTGTPKKRLEDALQTYLNQPLTLDVQVGKPVAQSTQKTPAQLHQQARVDKQRDAEQSISNDPMVQQLKDTFDATVLDGSIKPIK